MTRSVEIPEEAVKAASRAVCGMTVSHDSVYFPISENDAEEAAELALEAALPYLASAGDGGLREALKRGIVYALQCSRIGAQWPDEQIASAVLTGLDDKRRGWDIAHPAAPPVPQPVDREALLDRDAVRAALAFESELDAATDALMELARPMPTRKQIEAAIDWRYVSNRTVRATIADAVLAVLAGEQEQVEK